MTIIGILLTLAGLGGFIVSFAGIWVFPGVLANPWVWAAIGAAGAILTILTRRPGD
jgi:hypothetical protein